jgi:hypothetical protein
MTLQVSADLDRILLSFMRQWKIRSSGMLSRDAPFGFSVTHKP